MSPDLKRILISLLALAVALGLSRLMATLRKRAAPAEIGDGTGRIRPSRLMVSVFIALLAGVVFLKVPQALNDPMAGGTRAFVIITLVLIPLAFTGFSRAQDIRWSEAGVECPRFSLRNLLIPARQDIRWSEFATLSRWGTSYWTMKTSDGRKVRWSSAYNGFPHFTNAVRKYRPDLWDASAAKYD
jgi:hypothetical protein